MRHRRIASLVIGLCALELTSCSSSSSSSMGNGGGPYGGQTGSLTPPCGVAPLTTSGAPVAAGNNIAVVYTAGCPNAGSVTVIGPDGKPVPTSLVPLNDNGAYVIRSDTPINPGSYAISLPDSSAAGSTDAGGSEQVSVGATAPLPTSLGTLTFDSGSACDHATFTLTLDPAAVPYASLIALDASVDGGDTFTWVPYGALDLQGNQSTLTYNCLGDCGLRGTHTLTVTATIAGQSAAFDTQSVSFTSSCPVRQSDATPATNCSLSAGRNPGNWAAVVAVLGSVAGIRWRRKRSSG